MNDSILIISFYFPPIPGVGGRRWAKFVKFLSKKQEFNIHVISAKNSVKHVSSSYMDELRACDFNHLVLPSKYPKHIEHVEFMKRSIVQRANFKFHHALIRKRVKGNYWDNSVFWKSYFKKEIPELIRKNEIEKIIISGPPFRYTKYALEMRKVLSGIEIILDYRDPWNDFNEPLPLSEKRKQFEIDLEIECLSSVDKILVVSEFQKNLLLQKGKQLAPIYVLRNGFDTDDLLKNLKPKKQSDKIRISHFGTLHVLKDYYWKPFINALSKIKKELPDLYEKLEVDFIGFCPKEIIQYKDEKEIKINLLGVLEPSEAYDELNQADIALWFKYDGSPGDFATKFGDYIALKKYMWTFSKKGAVTDHIEEQKIGKIFYRSDENLEQSIFESLCELKNKDGFKFNENYDSSSLSIKSLTNDLIQILED